MAATDLPRRSIREAVHAEAVDLLGELDGEGFELSGDSTSEAA